MSDTAQPSFKDKMMKALGKFSGSRFVRAIMGAGYSIIAFSIIGSMFLVLTVLTQVITTKGFVDFYNNTFGRQYLYCYLQRHNGYYCDILCWIIRL